MDENTAQKLISEHFPHIVIKEITKIGEGEGNMAYEVNTTLIFRFPKSKESQRQLKREISIQGVLKKHAPLPIPEFIFLPDDHSFVGYKKLLGRSMLDLRTEFKNWDSFSRQMGSFLSRLHAIPQEELGNLDLITEDRSFKDWQKFGQAYYKKINYLIPGKYSQKIEQFFHSKFPANKQEIVLCHNDLGIEHILLTENKVTGIIDWGGVALTDPACDFARIYRDLGDRILDSILAEYSGTQEKKNKMRERATFYGKCLIFEDLFYGIEHKEYMPKALAGLEWMFNDTI
jgi:aminoglycoside phosphotransferase (APT) family kinase protein